PPGPGVGQPSYSVRTTGADAAERPIAQGDRGDGGRRGGERGHSAGASHHPWQEERGRAPPAHRRQDALRQDEAISNSRPGLRRLAATFIGRPRPGIVARNRVLAPRILTFRGHLRASNVWHPL